MMATADGPMGPAPVEQPTSAIQALAEFLGMEAQRQATVEQVASAAMQMLMEMAAGGGDPMMATADGPMGPEAMPMEEEDPWARRWAWRRRCRWSTARNRVVPRMA
jgi:hypothetical protein